MLFKKFLSLLESYCHPSNFGRWSRWIYEMIYKISECIINRLYYESNEKLTWQKPVPEYGKLKDVNVVEYVKDILNIVMIAVPTRCNGTPLRLTLYNLAVLKPEIVIPRVLDLFSKSLEHTTEPKMFLCALECMTAVSQRLVQGAINGYPEGPTHVFDILFLCLPAIDPSNYVKAYKSLICIENIISLMPLISTEEIPQHVDLNMYEEKTLMDYGRLDDFLYQLLDKCLLLIADSEFTLNSDLETHFELFSAEKWEKYLHDLIFSIIPRMSPVIFLACLNKICNFVFSRILDVKASGRLIAFICSIMAKAHPEETLNCFMPKLLTNILAMVDANGEIQEESVEEELLYYLLILSEVVDCESNVLTKYSDDICEILDRTFNSSSREVVKLAASILKSVFTSLTYLTYSSNVYLHQKHSCPVKDFGLLRDIRDLKIQWHGPRDDNFNSVHFFIAKYVIPSVEYIKKLLNKTVNFERDKLIQRLKIIEAGLETENLLPISDEPLDSVYIHKKSFTLDSGMGNYVKLSDGSSLYDYVLYTISNLQDYLLKFEEDDTKSLLVIVQIWSLFFNKCPSPLTIKDEFRSQRHFMNDRLRKKYLGKHISYHLEKLRILRLMRAYYSETVVTKSHIVVLDKLVTLCACKYRTVRVQAQNTIFQAVDRISSLPIVIIPMISKLVRSCDKISSSTYKGIVLTLFGPPRKPMICDHNLDLYKEILPLLVTTVPNEEESHNELLDTIECELQEKCPKLLFASTKISESTNITCEGAELKFFTTCLSELHISKPVADKIKESQIAFDLSLKLMQEKYYYLLNTIMTAVTEKELHWRQQKLGLIFLYSLGMRHVKYPSTVICYVLDTIIHDNLHLRHVALKIFRLILRQHKMPYKKCDITLNQLLDTEVENDGFGERPANVICKFNLASEIKTQEEWDKNFFVHSSVGFAPWPKTIEIFAPHNEQPITPEELLSEQNPVLIFFKNRDNIKKLLQHLKLEDPIYLKCFNRNIAKMFKILFQNHGEAFLENFRLEFNELACNSQERSQILAMEILAGIIKGSKHWSYVKQQNVWVWLRDMLFLILKHLPADKLEDWHSFLYYVSCQNHPKRISWLYKILHNEIKNNFDSSQLFSRKLFSMQCVMFSHEWQIEMINKDLFSVLVNLCTSEYDLIRERVAGVLVEICMADIGYGNIKDTYSPKVKTFVHNITSKLEIGLKSTITNFKNSKDNESLDLCESDSQNGCSVHVFTTQFDRRSARTLLKTISTWIEEGSIRFIGIRPEIYHFLPFLIMMENDDDLEVSLACKNAITHLAEMLVLPCYLPFILEDIKMASNNEFWLAKISTLQFIEVISLHNIAVFSSRQEWVTKLMAIILKFLEDDRYEVRLKAGEALSGFIHCNIVDDKRSLLVQIEKLCNEDCARRKHAGIVGLCAFLNASPYYYNKTLTKVFQLLIKHFRDSTMSTNTIKMTVGEFIRTHYYDWSDIKQLLMEENIEIEELVIPPDYYI